MKDVSDSQQPDKLIAQRGTPNGEQLQESPEVLATKSVDVASNTYPKYRAQEETEVLSRMTTKERLR